MNRQSTVINIPANSINIQATREHIAELIISCDFEPQTVQVLEQAITMLEHFEYYLLIGFDGYTNLLVSQIEEVLNNPDLDNHSLLMMNRIQQIIRSTVINKDQYLYIEQNKGEFDKESLKKFLIDCIDSGDMKPNTQSVLINVLFVFNRLNVTTKRG